MRSSDTERPLKALLPPPSRADDDSDITRPAGRSESIDSTDTCTDSTASEVDGLDGSAPGGDDKAIVVLATSELLPLDNFADEQAAMRRAIRNSDWLVQYSAIETFRRAIVHHTAATIAFVDDDLLRRLQDASVNLRSAMSKNALLALAECFEFAPDEMAAMDLAPLVESMLNRAACEKKFLRDAADYALEKLAAFVPTLRVLAAMASVAGSKNSKLCVAGCTNTVLCLQELKARQTTLAAHESTNVLIRQLVAFRSGKDAKTRDGALAALRLVSDLVGGTEAFETMVGKAVPSAAVALKVTSDTKMASRGRPRAKENPRQGGSLRDNLRLNRATVE